MPTAHKFDGGLPSGSLYLPTCRISIWGVPVGFRAFLHDDPFPLSFHLIHAPPRMLSVSRLVVLLHGSTSGAFLKRSTDDGNLIFGALLMLAILTISGKYCFSTPPRPNKHTTLRINDTKNCDGNMKRICGGLGFQIIKKAWSVMGPPMAVEAALTCWSGRIEYEMGAQEACCTLDVRASDHGIYIPDTFGLPRLTITANDIRRGGSNLSLRCAYLSSI